MVAVLPKSCIYCVLALLVRERPRLIASVVLVVVVVVVKLRADTGDESCFKPVRAL